jgi:hypothetical protein
MSADAFAGQAERRRAKEALLRRERAEFRRLLAGLGRLPAPPALPGTERTTVRPGRAPMLCTGCEPVCRECEPRLCGRWAEGAMKTYIPGVSR